MPRLLLDQGVPRGTALALRGRSWHAVHVGELDMHRAKDREVLAYALKEGFVCVTLDSDFHTILATTGAKGPSTIRIRREGLRADAMANLIVDLWPRIESAAMSGALITVTAESIRIKFLPVSRGK